MSNELRTHVLNISLDGFEQHKVATLLVVASTYNVPQKLKYGQEYYYYYYYYYCLMPLRAWVSEWVLEIEFLRFRNFSAEN